MDAGRAAVAAVWAATAVGVVAVLALAPAAARPVWLALAVGLSVVAGMAAQLAVAEQRGFVLRLAASVTGSFVLIGGGELVALALR